MNVMPPSIAAWTRRVASRSVFGRPRCHPPSARMETGMLVRPNGRVGTTAEDVAISPPSRATRPRDIPPAYIVARSLLPQSGHRVDAGRAPRRHAAGEQRDGEEQRGHG